MQAYEQFCFDWMTAIKPHLHPGAFIFAFASSRGWHRLAVAIEDAGMVIQPSIFGWCSSQAFPKATRIDTQIDKRKGYKPGFVHDIQDFLNGARKSKGLTYKDINQVFGFPDNSGMAGHWMGDRTQPIIPRLEYWPKLKQLLDLDDSFDEAIEAHEREVTGKAPWTNSVHHFVPGEDHTERVHLDITAPATDLARAWVGHRYGGQVLKNALEPIICAQKPWTDCIVETGAGALWVDGGRIGTERITQHGYPGEDLMGAMKGDGVKGKPDYHQTQGRWPPNFVLHPGCQRVGVRKIKGTGEVTQGGMTRYTQDGANYPRHGQHPGFADPDGTETVADYRCTESCPVRRLGEQSGEKPTPPGYKRNVPVGLGDGNKYGKSKLRHEAIVVLRDSRAAGAGRPGAVSE
jgi:hypothetical protein